MDGMRPQPAIMVQDARREYHTDPRGVDVELRRGRYLMHLIVMPN
jgi:hypothetical protein